MIKERIEKALEKEITKTGKMGTETVTVELDITYEESKEFLKLDVFDNEHFSWNLEKGRLTINYTEDV